MKDARFCWVSTTQPSRIDRKFGVLCFVAVVAGAAPCRAQDAPEPEPAPAPGAPAAQPESLADMPEQEWPDESEPEKPVVREGLVILPSLGLAFAGSGTMKGEVECQAGACTSSSRERDYDQNENLLLGFDTLYHVLPSLRLGLGLQWMPTSEMDFENGDSDADFGDELATTAVVEGVFGGKSAAALRGFIGANFMFPGGELEDLIDVMDAACRSVGSAGGSCSVADGPYVGLTLGAAAAFLKQVSEEAALRVELSLQYVSFSGPSIEISDESATGKESLSWSGTRLSLRFGIEF